MLQANPILALEDLCVHAGRHRLLQGVSFALMRGEMRCVIGESGSGKSTLLKALQGLMPATCRYFRFDPAEVDVAGEMPNRLGLPRTRWVMQDPLAALNPRQSLGKSIAESYADQILVLKSGQVEACQPRDAFLAAPASRYARDLIAAAGALGALRRAEAAE